MPPMQRGSATGPDILTAASLDERVSLDAMDASGDDLPPSSDYTTEREDHESDDDAFDAFFGEELPEEAWVLTERLGSEGGLSLQENRPYNNTSG